MKLVSKVVMGAITVALLGSFLVVPNVAAQDQCTAAQGAGPAQLQIELKPASRNVKPIVDQLPLAGNILYSYALGYSQTPIIIDLTAVMKASYGSASVSPAQLVVPVPSSPTPNSYAPPAIPFSVLVIFNRDAPAFQPTEVLVKAQASAGTCVKAVPQKDSNVVPVKPDFFGIIAATADRAIVKSSQNNQLQLPIKVENFGNGQIKVFFSTQAGKGIEVVTPEPRILDSTAQGGKKTSEIVNLNVNTPYKNGYMNKINSVNVEITSTSAEDTSIQGDKAALSMLVRTQGVYVPGFDSVLMLAALVGAAALVGLSRRKKE